MGDGRALQAGTSHNLGQNFAKAFDITFQARDKSVQHVWGTSWGMTTRLIGARDHGARRRQRARAAAADRAVSGRHRADRPRQLARDRAAASAQEIQRELTAAGIRVTLDEREERPGWKFAEWELRGVPLRLEIGPKDIEKSAVLVARRDTREKQSLPMDGLAGAAARAARRRSSRTCSIARVAFRDEHTQRVATYDEFKQVMEGRPGFVIAPWCGSAECEAQIKTETQATIRNMPLDPPAPSGALHSLRQPRETRGGLVREELLGRAGGAG